MVYKRGRMQQQNKHKKSSMLMQTKQRIEEKQRETDEITSQFQQIENLLSEVDRTKHEIAECEAAVSAAKSDVDKLTDRDAELKEKRERTQELERGLNARKNQLSELKGALQKLQEYHNAVQKVRQALGEKEKEHDLLQRAVEDAKATANKASLKREETENLMLQLGQVRQKLEAMQRLLQIVEQVEQKKREIVTAEAEVATAQEEVRQLINKNQELTEKREKAWKSENVLREKQNELDDLKQALQKYQQYKHAVERAEQRLQQKQEEQTLLQQALDSARQVLEAASQKEEAADNAMQELDGHRAQLDAMRHLLEIQEEAGQTTSRLEKARQKETQIQSIEEKLKKLLVPEKNEIDRIKRLLDRLRELEAEIKAAQLKFTINPTRTASVVLEIDRQGMKKVSLKAGQAIERSARQRIQLGIEDFGSVEIGRGKEEAGIEKQASVRDALNNELSGLLARWGVVQLERSEVIPELTRRATEQKEWKNRLKEHRNELAELVPEGIPALEAAIEKGKMKRANLLQIHPKLAAWKPSRKSIQEAGDEFHDTEKKQKEVLRVAKDKEQCEKATFQKREEEAREIEREIFNLKIELAREETPYQIHQQQWGTMEEVSNHIGTKEQEVRHAKSNFETNRLTGEEEQVPRRLDAARNALNERETRWQGLQVQLANPTGQRQQLLEAYPQLGSWEPLRASLKKEENQFQERESHLNEVLRNAKRREEETRADIEGAQQKTQKIERNIEELKIELARQETTYGLHERQWGSSAELSRRIQVKELEVNKAQTDFDKHRLTEEEERVPEQLDAAKRALGIREDRLQTLREQWASLTGQLKSHEELHDRRVATEQGLEAAKREYKRIAIEVGAHRTLLALFDEIRDEHVEKSIAPVKELVDPWLRELDGIGHPKVAFDTNLQVSGLTVLDGASRSVDEATSYGEREQLGTIIRLAYGAVLAKDEPQVVILDDPFAHSDPFRHRKMLEIIAEATKKNLQIIILTCHLTRFDHLKDAQMFDLKAHLESATAGG